MVLGQLDGRHTHQTLRHSDQVHHQLLDQVVSHCLAYDHPEHLCLLFRGRRAIIRNNPPFGAQQVLRKMKSGSSRVSSTYR